MTAPLPLDVVLEIAARSDPATLVRCAATCRDARRRVAGDPAFRRRLRLRHADRFVPSLLRGCLIRLYKYNTLYYSSEELRLVDATAATSKLVTAADGFPPPNEEPSRRQHEPLASRDGLVLVRAYGEEMRVCDTATGHGLTLPPEPTFPDEGRRASYCWQPYVLLVGDAEGRRPFQVLKTDLMLSYDCRYLQLHTFSSQAGTWGPYTKVQTPQVHGAWLLRGGGRPLVTGSVVHWLCLTNRGGYVIKLDASTTQVSVTTLPACFPHNKYGNKYLLATTPPTGERLVVLVADDDKISLWTQSKLTAKWEQRPQVVITNQDIVRFSNEGGLMQRWPNDRPVKVQLHWFAERSGIALIQICGHGFFLLDLGSKGILGWFPDYHTSYPTTCCPYEMDLSSWVPTFTCNL